MHCQCSAKLVLFHLSQEERLGKKKLHLDLLGEATVSIHFYLQRLHVMEMI